MKLNISLFGSIGSLGIGSDSPVNETSFTSTSPDNNSVSHGIFIEFSIAYKSPGTSS